MAAATRFPGRQESGDILCSAPTHEKPRFEENQVKATVFNSGGRILGRLALLSDQFPSGPEGA